MLESRRAGWYKLKKKEQAEEDARIKDEMISQNQNHKKNE